MLYCHRRRPPRNNKNYCRLACSNWYSDTMCRMQMLLFLYKTDTFYGKAGMKRNNESNKYSFSSKVTKYFYSARLFTHLSKT